MKYLEDDEISTIAHALVADAISVYGHKVYDRFDRVASDAGIKVTIDEIDQESLDTIVDEFSNFLKYSTRGR